jgi:hypothetical protein
MINKDIFDLEPSCPAIHENLEEIEGIVDKIKSALTVGEIETLKDNILFIGFKLEDV